MASGWGYQYDVAIANLVYGDCMGNNGQGMVGNIALVTYFKLRYARTMPNAVRLGGVVLHVAR